MKLIYSHEYRGSGGECSQLKHAATAPPWRRFERHARGTGPAADPQPRAMSPSQSRRAMTYSPSEHEARMVSAAIVLRRPLLVTGIAGVGKSSLAMSVAWQLGLGDVLRWNVTSRSTLKDALYDYDAVSRLHDAGLGDRSKGNPAQIADYVTLGPLGTAFLPSGTSGYFPRVVLIDELDKADADLPSDLLHVLEEGNFHIREIARHSRSEKTTESLRVQTADGTLADIPPDGMIQAEDFPLIIMTSNGERDFPAAFKRRCLPLEIHRPAGEKLKKIVERHLGEAAIGNRRVAELINEFGSEDHAVRATDQLLNAIQLMTALELNESDWESLKRNIIRPLTDVPVLEPESE